MNDITMNEYARINMPRVDILKIRKLLENNYKVDHDLAEGIAEAIDVALKDQDLSNDFAKREDIHAVDHRVDKVIDRIDNLEKAIDARFDAVEQRINARFEITEHMIENSRKSVIIYIGAIVGAGFASMIGILLVGLVKYMPVISKIVEMLPKD
ncbi:hypothetical protein SZ25_00209 [Candidatus Arcanobacter lacustris]|uniref:DUF1640 domain-containing protein n=1 Tax=Candidatus Arcanibacter lacustris TaxID=1607817 RepID=A0A0F5MPM5_9RICK|nr:hypothetical protein SZ25_00209 [Candidatus Arcanobacter lacustris]